MLNLECPRTSYRRSSALPRKWSINPNTFPHTQLYCHHICKNQNMRWAQSRWHKWHIPIQASLLCQNSDGHMGGQVHLIEWQSTNPGISGNMRAWHCRAVRAMVSVPVRVEVIHWVSYAKPFLDTHRYRAWTTHEHNLMIIYLKKNKCNGNTRCTRSPDGVNLSTWEDLKKNLRALKVA